MEQRITARAAVFVDLPPEQVFAYVADVSRHGQWSPKDFRVTDLPLAGELVVGSTFTSYGQLPGRTDHRNDVRVVELEPPERIVLESTDASGTYRSTFVVTARGDGSTVLRELEMPRPGGLLGVTMPLFIRTVLGRDMSKGLRNLATRLRSQPRV